ncbi:MAG TPA: dienelactone hydrolase family protein [Chitinophagaceae bacterium]|nr:dienelactone hydrolase family protein [Chitinophagaceae bacterium]
MDQKIINLYDEYIHSATISRADFLKRLTLITGSIALTQSVLSQIENNYTKPGLVAGQDLLTEYVNYPGLPNEMKAYIARPKEEKKYAAVIVIHENRGLNAHIEDVTRRAATAGYLAIAPNALSALGKTFANEDEARAAFSTLKPEDNLKNFIGAFDYLKTRKDFNGKAGCVGFCWGGAMANNLAVNIPDLKAVVAFYGRQPVAADVPKIKAALQLHYAGLDEGVNAGIPAYEEALKANKITYELYMYEGVQHAFHNDTSAARYNEAAAKLAWQRTLDFYSKYLK